MNWAHQCVDYADDVNIFVENLNSKTQITSALLVTNEQVGREITCTFIPREQSAGQHVKTKIDNKSFENVAKLRYL